jgi:NADH:ubiquinone oxidoreductase subunit F (NADH-binding)
MTAVPTTPLLGAPGQPETGLRRVGHLAGVHGGGPGLEDHRASYGDPPRLVPGELAGLAAAAGLTGRGGAAFPTARKLQTVRANSGRRPAVVVANAAEGEPASYKDGTLLRARPNLVLDGLQLAATEVAARRVVLYLHRDVELAGSLRALLDRRERLGVDARHVEIVGAPDRFLAGEETALVSRVGGGLALPGYTPPRVFEAGVDGAPTLVHNAETLAQLALVARFGPAWFRSAGLPEEPGSMLATVHTEAGSEVLEAVLGAPLAALIEPSVSGAPGSAVLVGGYHGAWLPGSRAASLRLANQDLRPLGAAVGAGVIAALPEDRCGLVETARVVGYLAAESAGQCGPCLNGLPAIARGLAELAGQAPRSSVVMDVARWAGLVEGRGACHHPDGTVRLVRSALDVFAAEVQHHIAGRCTATSRRPFLPVPAGIPTQDHEWS